MFFLAACILQYKAHKALSNLNIALPAFALPERHAEHAAEHPPDPHLGPDMTHAMAHQTPLRCSARTGMHGPS